VSKFFEALERAERERAQRKGDRDSVAASLTKEDLRKDGPAEPGPGDVPPAASRPRVAAAPEAAVSVSVTEEVRRDVPAEPRVSEIPPATSRAPMTPTLDVAASTAVTRERIRKDAPADRKPAADVPPAAGRAPMAPIPDAPASAAVIRERVRRDVPTDGKPATDVPPTVRRSPVSRIPEAPATASIPVLPTQELPGSTVAESFRVLQANLIRALLEAKIRRVLVTSASGGEGRSTVVANLGIALSQAEQRVLIIDADVRRAQQHRLFDFGRSPGLIDYLLAEESLGDVIRSTTTRGLSLITAGRPVAAPAEPFSSRRMSELLQLAATQFDVVLLDAPAVLDVADTRVLAPLADGVLVVARAGTVTREALRQVRQSLQQVHARVLGVVLNQLAEARTRSAE
jgi:capsular exopolysaccharide synthesis family protein